MNPAPPKRNLLADLPDAEAAETFETIVTAGHLLIERIVSRGHSTPAGEWCCQELDEWVMVLAGRAELLFEGEVAQRMETGDTVLIPAGRRHRVEWTDPDLHTVWLAVHFEPKNGGDS